MDAASDGDFNLILHCRQRKEHVTPQGQASSILPDVQNGKLRWSQLTLVQEWSKPLLCLRCRDAWHSLGTLSQQEAMSNYVALVDRLDPGWENKKDVVSEASVSWTRKALNHQIRRMWQLFRFISFNLLCVFFSQILAYPLVAKWVDPSWVNWLVTLRRMYLMTPSLHSTGARRET